MTVFAPQCLLCCIGTIPEQACSYLPVVVFALSPLPLAVPEHLEAAATLAPNSSRFPLRCGGTAPFCPSDHVKRAAPALESQTPYTWHLGFAMAPVKLIQAARKGGGNLFLGSTRKTAAALSQWQKNSQEKGRAVLLPQNFHLQRVSTFQDSPCANLQLVCADERNSRALWRKPELFLFLVE